MTVLAHIKPRDPELIHDRPQGCTQGLLSGNFLYLKPSSFIAPVPMSEIHLVNKVSRGI